jgi:hypothetical protein
MHFIAKNLIHTLAKISDYEVYQTSACTTVYPKVSGLSHNEINNNNNNNNNNNKHLLRSDTKFYGGKTH